jgi:hypothetical protein
VAIAALPSVSGAARPGWPRPPERDPVATAPPPRARRRGPAGAAPDAAPIDVDVLWEELGGPAPPARARFRPYVFGGAVPLAPPSGVVHDAYAMAMRRPARPPRVDLLAV